jgi:integrase
MLPAWGSRKVRDITRRDVVLLLDKVRERAPITANRLHGRLTRFFNFACERGVIDTSPCACIRKTEERPRERVLTDSEIARVWTGLEDTGIRAGTALALRLVLVTGQRSGEVAGMAWSEIEGNAWTIPARRAKNRREHGVPLTDLALELLEQARDQTGASVYVFPSPRADGNRRPITVRSLSRALDRKLGEQQKCRIVKAAGMGLSKFTPHDLRRTVRTRLAELGVNDVVAERVLNHTLQGIARVYNHHDYQMQMRDALVAWERMLLRIVGRAGTSTNVVVLKAV